MIGDYGLSFDILTMFSDKFGLIDISKIPVQHFRTKHIDIKYHFIRDLIEENLISIENQLTENIYH